MIQVERLCKRFADLTAVDDLSFEVEDGITFPLLFFTLKSGDQLEAGGEPDVQS